MKPLLNDIRHADPAIASHGTALYSILRMLGSDGCAADARNKLRRDCWRPAPRPRNSLPEGFDEREVCYHEYAPNAGEAGLPETSPVQKIRRVKRSVKPITSHVTNLLMTAQQLYPAWLVVSVALKPRAIRYGVIL